GVPQQRPAGRDALVGGRPARRALPRAPGQARGGAHREREGVRDRSRPPRGGRRGDDRRPAPRRAFGRRARGDPRLPDRGGGGGRTIPCDLVGLAGFQAPSTNLLAMTGAEVAFDEAAQAFLPTQLPPNVPAAGAAPAPRSLVGAIAQGRLAGLEAGVALGIAPADADERIERLRAEAAAEQDPI